MAVIKCKECGGLVSTKADKCPSCGAKQRKSVGIVGWLFAIFFVLPVAWNYGKNMGTSPSTSSRPSFNSSASVPDVEATPKAGWESHEITDAMTDKKGVIVSMRSQNGANFAFPYTVEGGSKLKLAFREKAGEFDAYLAIDKGNMQCGSFKCQFTLRVGDGPIQKWTGLPSSTHDSDMMFVRDAKALEKIIRTGVPIRIGIEFFQEGEHIFSFDTSGYPGL